MKKVLVDTNVALDFFLEREPFYQDAKRLFQAIATHKVEALISATSLKDIYYIFCRTTKDEAGALATVKRLLVLMQVCEVNKSTIERAIELNFKDFEDAIQVAAVEPKTPNVIVTRNARDFRGTEIFKMTPGQLLEQFE